MFLIFYLECPHGWEGSEDLGCYYVAKEASTMHYASAKAYCTSLDGRAHLAEIRTQEIQTFVAGLPELQSQSYWLGANDQATVCNISY